MNLRTYLQNLFTQSFLSLYPDLKENTFNAEVTQSTQAAFGHYQCNSAMKLTKLLKLPPQKIAQAVIEKVKENAGDNLAQIEMAGPGFINISLSQSFIQSCCQKMLDQDRLGIEKKNSKRVVIDFSSPNIAKEMHVGHLRSTIIGECIARVLEFLGHDVLRLNHVGDWGTSFGMLIAYIKKYEPSIITDNQVPLSTLVQCYKKSKKIFDEDPIFKKQSQLEVVALQSGDEDALKIWAAICEISRNSYQEIYDILDIDLTERGESFYNPLLKATVDELQLKGILETSEGAKCMFLEGYTNREGEPLPFMLQKSDGGFNYSTTDMAAIKQRIFDEKAQWLIYVTDVGQSTHFAMLFKAAEKAGWLDLSKVRADHVPFGLVLGPDGKKFKTRSGDTERLIDLIYTAIDKAQEILKGKEKTQDRTEKEIQMIAKTLGVNAIKYADLSSNRNHDYQFSYDRMLQFEGNTAAFLMYAFVRIHGIKRQLQEKDIQLPAEFVLSLTHESEVNLALHLARFHETLEALTEDLLPHRLCEYLYLLADKYNAFFRDCRVIGSPEQAQRLALCELSERILKQGLTLVGLSTVDRM